MYFIFDKFELVMISVQQIKYILAVAKTLNFKKAADICFVSPSTLSNGISEFEKNLGVHIFERDNKKVIITKIGKEIIKRLNEVKEIIIRKPNDGDLALQYIDYLIDDIFMYKNNSL